MKITKEFAPITLVIETKEDLSFLCEMMGRSTTRTHLLHWNTNECRLWDEKVMAFGQKLGVYK